MGTLAAGRDFVEIGCSVLLSDTDVVYIQNPFKFLYGENPQKPAGGAKTAA
jgi:hypothetical protein